MKKVRKWFIILFCLLLSHSLTLHYSQRCRNPASAHTRVGLAVLSRVRPLTDRMAGETPGSLWRGRPWTPAASGWVCSSPCEGNPAAASSSPPRTWHPGDGETQTDTDREGQRQKQRQTQRERQKQRDRRKRGRRRGKDFSYDDKMMCGEAEVKAARCILFFHITRTRQRIWQSSDNSLVLHDRRWLWKTAAVPLSLGALKRLSAHFLWLFWSATGFAV